MSEPLVRAFSELTLDDLPQVGGKNAALGEMIRHLLPLGVAVPEGFATTAEAFRMHLARGGLAAEIRAELERLDPGDVEELARRGRRVRERILGAPLPEDLVREIRSAYRELGRRYGEEATDVAVRSSATAEDLPEASFAGQQETFLAIRGEAALLDACRRCYASLYTDRAIAYRMEKGFVHEEVALSVGVQNMVRSDLGAAGVMFTLDTETGFRDVVLLSAAYGLGENVVRGTVNPDEITIFKPTLAAGFRPIVDKRLGSKEIKRVYESKGGVTGTRDVPVPESARQRFAISDDEALELARWAVLIEEHFGRRAGEPRPMDIEWAKDGRTGELFVLQARPETVQAGRDRSRLTRYRLLERGPLLASGQAVGSGVGMGCVRRVLGRREMGAFREGEVLVTEMTDPDWVPVLRKAAAVVTERGGRTCHAAIVSRELGIPAVVGAAGALAVLGDGEEVTVSCAEGQVGHVYGGRLEVAREEIRLDEAAPPRTRLMLNLADPEAAFDLSFLPNDGVGLARMEFLVSESIGVHPQALVRYPELEDEGAAARIAELVRRYENPTDFFVDRLALGVARIAAAFYPKDVLLRLSDFKSNEYAGLLGGRELEPQEENPMLGFRGASRYDHPLYREGFALECAAVRRVREEMGLGNLKLMVPFCRTVEEGRRVVAALAREGLVQGKDGLEIWVMCEVPSNVVLAREFAEVFDGFSIGSNDLTQLVLGVDRDSETVAPLFDEDDPAVRWMIRRAIAEVHAAGKPIGLCGQAPSDNPAFAEFLVDCGIDSISVTPDSLPATRARLAAYEQEGGPAAEAPPRPGAPDSAAPAPRA